MSYPATAKIYLPPQITALVSVMSLDLKRMLKGKMDVLCCLSGVKVKPPLIWF